MITGYLLRIVLFGAIACTVFVNILGNSQHLKATIFDTRAYQRFIPSIIETNKANNQSNDGIPYGDSQISYLFADSFPSRDLRYNTELFIDGVYSWLKGETPLIMFRADFTRNRAQLASGLSDFAFKRLDKLPRCKTPPEQVNPLVIDCQPLGYNDPRVKQAYTNQLLTNDTFLGKATYSQIDLPKLTDGSTIEQKYHWVPLAFRLLSYSPYVLWTLTVVLGCAYMALGPRRRAAVSSLASLLISAGVGLVVLPLLFDFVLPKLIGSSGLGVGGNGTQKIVNDIVNHLYRQIDIYLIIYGGTVAVIGLFVYLIERLTRPASRYTHIGKKSGLASSNEKPQASPKSLKGGLDVTNIPLVSSDQPVAKNSKRPRKAKKYRTLYIKKGS